MPELYNPDDILAFQESVLELTAEYDHVPIISLIGALHTAAHILTSAAFDPVEDEGDGQEELPFEE